MIRFGCRRFGHLLNELADREATPREEAFLSAHREACARCREEEAAASFSLDLLRGAAFETAPVEDSFDRRVIRRARAQQVGDSVRYWSPALVGGVVAAGLLLAAVQALTRPIEPGATPPVQASRGVTRSLALKGTPHLLGQ